MMRAATREGLSNGNIYAVDPTPYTPPGLCRLRYTLPQTFSNKGADMSIKSKPATEQYRKNWDKIFKKPILDRTKLERPCNGENYVVKSK